MCICCRLAFTNLDPYDESTTRQQLDSELKFFSHLEYSKHIIRRDVDRSGAIFTLLYTQFEPYEAASIAL